MHFKIQGHLQYKTQAEGDACDAWLTGWVAQHASEITSGSHSLTNTLDPPDTGNEGCVVQLDVEYHFDTDAPGASDSYQAEVEAAIYGGPDALGQGDCNSSFGS